MMIFFCDELDLRLDVPQQNWLEFWVQNKNRDEPPVWTLCGAAAKARLNGLYESESVKDNRVRRVGLNVVYSAASQRDRPHHSNVCSLYSEREFKGNSSAWVHTQWLLANTSP